MQIFLEGEECQQLARLDFCLWRAQTRVLLIGGQSVNDGCHCHGLLQLRLVWVEFIGGQERLVLFDESIGLHVLPHHVLVSFLDVVINAVPALVVSHNITFLRLRHVRVRLHLRLVGIRSHVQSLVELIHVHIHKVLARV